MRTTAFASRNTKEILRDPVTLFFGLGFPLVLLVLLSAINSSIPEQADMKLFHIESLGPYRKGQSHKLYASPVHLSA